MVLFFKKEHLAVRRRDLLRAAVALAAEGPPLAQLASRRNILFGAAVEAPSLRVDPGYAALIAQECAIVVPATEAKFAPTEPQEGRFRFGPLDEVLAFARTHGLRVRLHNLVWGVYNPPWLQDALDRGAGEAVLRQHIAAVAGHTRGQALAWDVLNEPSDPRWNAPDGLVNIPWKRALGPSYADVALRAAHQADPKAQLFINDDLLEYADAASAAKRAAYLRLIEAMLRRGLPLHGFGLECHLRPERAFAGAAYRAFLRDLAAMGLVLHITELDVCDRTLPADPMRRGAEIAARTRDLCATALDERGLRAVLTWGITTRYSWLATAPDMRRADGRAPLGLPYDAKLQPTPMRAALAAAFAAAPVR